MARLNYTSIATLMRLTTESLPKIPRDIDGVVGVQRSGMLPATWIALARELPLADVGSAARGEFWRRATTPPEHPRRILLVEDAVYDAKQLTAARRALKGLYPEIVTYAVERNPTRRLGVAALDIWGVDVTSPRVMEWNIWRHIHGNRFATDLDGVLCPDPPVGEGPRYERWLSTVEPLVVPRGRIGHIITARVERYRPETEAWLASHGIEYGQLWMLNATPEERRRNRLYVPHKAKSYKRSKAWLFVESDTRQAKGIAEATGLPVLDWSTRELV